MKKITCLLFVLLNVIALFSGCSEINTNVGPYSNLQGTWIDNGFIQSDVMSVDIKFVIEADKGYYYIIAKSGNNIVGEDEPKFTFTLITENDEIYCQQEDGTKLYKIKAVDDKLELYHKSSNYTELGATMIKEY